uniref:ANK_REP_REGION domain-containing protein n=1 Tax=Macrostomum lignano TaxID=282301 RepID=A0A1I8FCG6_9PLAT
MLMEIAAAAAPHRVEDDMASDFDAKILASLLGMPQSAGDDAGGNGEKAAGEDSEVLNVDQLRIAMSIDRCDIARTKILTDAKKMDSKTTWSALMLQALRDNQTEFAELMVEQASA